jgi:hypothetical protein
MPAGDANDVLWRAVVNEQEAADSQAGTPPPASHQHDSNNARRAAEEVGGRNQGAAAACDAARVGTIGPYLYRLGGGYQHRQTSSVGTIILVPAEEKDGVWFRYLNRKPEEASFPCYDSGYDGRNLGSISVALSEQELRCGKIAQQAIKQYTALNELLY